MKHHHRWVRALLLAGAALLAPAALLPPTSAVRHPAELRFDALLAAGAGWLLLVLGGWAGALLAAAALETGTQGRWRLLHRMGAPPSVRRLALATAGVVVLGVAGGPAHADDGPTGSTTATRGGTVADATGALPVPVRPSDRPSDLPTGRRTAAPAPVPPTGTPVDPHPDQVVVHAGDTLWGLARDRLRPGAEDGDVLRLVHRVHRLNRAVVGPDPDLIVPGQHLVIPRSTRPATEEPS